MKICGLEKLSMVDFGSRLCATVFVAGCNLSCPFCHNGDLVTLQHLQYIAESSVLDYLQQRKTMLDGVVVSGGEPTLQPDLAEFLNKIKLLGLAIKIDTNGTSFEVLKQLVTVGLVDYVSMDIKNSIDSYSQTAGKDLSCGQGAVYFSNIKQSVEFLKTNAVDYEFRTTLISQLHTKEDINQMAHWLNGAKRIYLQKFEDKHGYLANGTLLTATPKQTAEEYAEILSKTISQVELRGY